MTLEERKLLRRMAAHQLRMGQAIVLLLRSTPGVKGEGIDDSLGSQNHYLDQAICELKDDLS